MPGWRTTFSDEFASDSAKNRRTEGRLRAAATHHGIPLADWLDLSTDINPDPWPVPALPAGVWRHLPEEEDGLEAMAADHFSSASLLPVAGSQAAIQLLPMLLPAGSRHLSFAALCRTPAGLVEDRPSRAIDRGSAVASAGSGHPLRAAVQPEQPNCCPPFPAGAGRHRQPAAAAGRLADRRRGVHRPDPGDSVADLAGTALLATLRAADSADLHAALARSGILTGHFAAHGLLRLGLPGQESGWERLRIGLHSIVRSPHQARGGSGDDGP